MAERELREAGHPVERTYEGGPAEGQWLVWVNGEPAAERPAIGALEDALRRWRESPAGKDLAGQYRRRTGVSREKLSPTWKNIGNLCVPSG